MWSSADFAVVIAEAREGSDWWACPAEVANAWRATRRQGSSRARAFVLSAIYKLGFTLSAFQ
jgi:hypothetical protein